MASELDVMQQIASALSGTPIVIPGNEGARISKLDALEAILLAAKAINNNSGNYAPKDSPVFTGNPTAPTPVKGNNTTRLATTAFVQAVVNDLVNASPAALDTLKELADALGNDANFATTVTNNLATKAPLDSASLTGNPTAPTQPISNSSTRIATTEFVWAQPPIATIADNTATGGNARGVNAVDWQTLRGVATQVASGIGSTISGGTNNTSSGQNSFVAGGSSNTASGSGAGVLGGVGNIADAIGSYAYGSYALTRGAIGKVVYANGRVTTTDFAQVGQHVFRGQLTTNGSKVLTSDNGTAIAGNTITLPNFSVFCDDIVVVAKKLGSTDAAVWRLNASAVRGNGAATVVLFEGGGTSIAPTAFNGAGNAWTLAVAANTTLGGISLTVTGVATMDTTVRAASVEVVAGS